MFSSERGMKDAAWDADHALVKRVLLREADALDEFVVRMQCVPRFLLQFDQTYGGVIGRAGIEDLMQEVLVTVWRRLAEYRGEARLETWVFRISDFQFRNARRRVERRRGVSLGDAEELAMGDEGVRDSDDGELLAVGIDQLPKEQADVIRLKHYEDLTFEEVALLLGLSSNTAKTRYYRALDSLRRWLRTQDAG